MRGTVLFLFLGFQESLHNEQEHIPAKTNWILKQTTE